MNPKPSNLNVAAMASQSQELRQQVNTQATKPKLALPPTQFPKGKSTSYRANQEKQAPRNDGLQRVVNALKQEILDLKKGQNNLQSVTELKYVKGRVSSLEKSLADRDATIADLKNQLGFKDAEIANLRKDVDEARNTAIDSMNNPVGPGATSPDTAA